MPSAWMPDIPQAPEATRNSTISFLASLGDDVIKSQYAFILTGGIPIDRQGTRIYAGLTEILTFRQQGSVSLPERKVGTYSIEYQGLSIKKVAPKDENSKEFSVQIRLDADGIVYAALDSWYRAIFNEWDGSIGRMKDLVTIADLFIFRLNKQPALHFRFYDVLLYGLGGGEVDHGAAEPMVAEASFVYTYFDRFILNSADPNAILLNSLAG